MASYNKYKIHVAQVQERWDDLAYKYYGDCLQHDNRQLGCFGEHQPLSGRRNFTKPCGA